MRKIHLTLWAATLAAVTTILFHATQQGEIGYWKAHRLFSSTAYAAAADEYEKSLERQPGRLDVLKELARSYQWSKNYPKAIETYRQVLAADPEDLDSKTRLAETLGWSGQYAESIALYREVVAKKNDTAAKLALSEVLLWNKDYAAAESSTRDVLKVEPTNPQARYLLGKILQASGRPQEATVLFEELLKEQSLKK